MIDVKVLLMQRFILASAMLVAATAASALIKPGAYEVIAPDQHRVMALRIEPNSYLVSLDTAHLIGEVLMPVQEQAQPVALTNCNGSARGFGYSGVCRVTHSLTGLPTNQIATVNLSIENANTTQPMMVGTVTVSGSGGGALPQLYHVSACSMRRLG